MGSQTDQAERSVVEQRARISLLLDDLEQRVRTDLRDVSDGLSERTADIAGRAGEALNLRDHVPGTEMLSGQVSTHPLTAMVSGFGAGIALGIAGSRSNGSEDPRPQPGTRRAKRETERDDAGTRMIDILASIAVSTVTTPIRDEIAVLVRQGMSAFLGNDTEPRARR